MKHYYDARYQFLWCQTTEEDRIIREHRKIFDETIPFFSWDISAGFRGFIPSGEEDGWVWIQVEIPGYEPPKGPPGLKSIISDPSKALDAVRGLPEGSFIFMKDYHKYFDKISVIREALNLKDDLKMSAKTICFLSASQNIPAELVNDITVIDYPYPNEQALRVVLNKMAEENSVPVLNNPDNIVNAMRGLTCEGAENALALSLVAKGEFDVKTILDQKATQLKSGSILEYGQFPETLDGLYGLEVMKDYIMKTIRNPKARGILLYGVPGCIAGDASSIFLRGAKKGGRPYTLENAYFRFNGIHTYSGKAGNPYKGKGCIWDEKYPTYTLSWLGDRVGYNKIDEIIFSGEKDLYKVSTETGKSIKATLNHPFMVLNGGDEEGFLPLSSIREGDYVYTRKTEMSNGGKKKRWRKEVCTKFHPYGRSRTINNCEYSFVPLPRATLEAEMNNMSLPDFVSRLKLSNDRLTFLPKNIIIHHKDGDPTNNNPKNLQIFNSIQEHNAVHPDFSSNFGNQNIITEKITKISFAGKDKTYDVKMADPYRSVVLNDFVVHNSGKSHTAKAVANEMGWPCLILRFSALKDKYQGVAESRLRDAFKTIRAFGRCVVFMDEIEAIAVGISSGGDSGVGQSLFKDLLIELEDSRGCGAYWIGTCNALDPLIKESGGALLRRFNAKFFCDMPSMDEARGIAKIWEKKEKIQIPEDYDFTGYSGANIAELAATMSMMGCSAGEAQQYILPYGVAHKEELEAIRSRAAGVCIWASKPSRLAIATTAKRKVSKRVAA